MSKIEDKIKKEIEKDKKTIAKAKFEGRIYFISDDETIKRKIKEYYEEKKSLNPVEIALMLNLTRKGLEDKVKEINDEETTKIFELIKESHLYGEYSGAIKSRNHTFTASLFPLLFGINLKDEVEKEIEFVAE